MEVKPEHIASVYAQLLTLARSGQTIFYSDLGLLVDITEWVGNHPQNYIAHVLEHISRVEHFAGRPMLTAVVINKANKSPGGGFYLLATDLGLFNGSTKEEQQAFWTKELQKVFDFWHS